MTVLQSLGEYYDRIAARGDVEPQGYAREKFGWCVILAADGAPVAVVDLHTQSRGKLVKVLVDVPALLAKKRTVAVLPNLFWDKTAYSLGRTAGTGDRTAREHAAFRSANLAAVADSDDAGLLAFRRFLEGWVPARFDSPPFDLAMLDANVLFRLEGDELYLHDRPAARAVIDARCGHPDLEGQCLVTGAVLPLARIHRSIRGVEGAATQGGALVSFNLDASTSYGDTQGANAPTSENAAFRYTAALNRLLDHGSENRLKIGDMTVVFWADAKRGEASAGAAEQLFGELFNPAPVDVPAARVLGDIVAALAAGRPLSDLRPDVEPATVINVLGVTPNAARLAVKIWLSETLGVLVARLAQHYDDLQVAPLPWPSEPNVNALLVRTTGAFGRYEHIPSILAGEVTRSILTGTPYPRSLLAAVIGRLRAGDDAGSGWHAAVIKACINRRVRAGLLEGPTPTAWAMPVDLDRAHPSSAYQLGRLFAMYENVQRAAYRRDALSTIRDRHFGAAAGAARMFPMLARNARHHLAQIRRTKPGWAVLLEREIDEIVGRLPGTSERACGFDDQGRFAVGYYHQRTAKIGGHFIQSDSVADALSDDEEE